MRGPSLIAAGPVENRRSTARRGRRRGDCSAGSRSRWTGASSCSTYFYDDLGSAVKVKGATAQPSQSCDSSGNQPTRAEYCDTGSWNDSQSTYYCYDDFGRQIKSRGPGQSTGEIETLFYDGLDRRDYRLIGPSDYRDFQYVGLTEQLSKEQRPNGDVATYDYDSRGNRLAQNYKSGSGNFERRAYSLDASGSVETLEDPSGAKLGTYNYDPYGELVDPTPADGQDAEASLGAEAKQSPFRMQGFYYDKAIGSYDMQARQYQPSVGRFLSQDRFEDSGADLALQLDPLTQGRYVFAGGNPVNWIEFDGHDPCSGVMVAHVKKGNHP